MKIYKVILSSSRTVFVLLNAFVCLIFRIKCFVWDSTLISLLPDHFRDG